MTTDALALRDRLRAALPIALKARDHRTTSALRSALAAIENAEAVDAGDIRAGSIEASPVGLGVHEVARRHLTEDDVATIVRAEIAAHRAAAAANESSGHPDRAAELLAEADALAAHLS